MILGTFSFPSFLFPLFFWLEYLFSSKFYVICIFLVLQRAEQELRDWRTWEDSGTRGLTASQREGGMTCTLTDTWRVPKPCILVFCKQNTNHNRIKAPGRCWGCWVHQPPPASTSGFMGAGRRDCSALHPSSTLFPLSQSLLKKEEKLLTAMLSK